MRIALVLAFCISFSLSFGKTQGKPLENYLEKYNLPETTNILAVFENDCLNCYYGFAMFMQNHDRNLTKENFVILFNDISETELDNFFQYRFHIAERGRYRTIVDPEFYASVNSDSPSSLIVIKNKSIINRYDHLTIKNFKGFSAPSLSVEKADTLDLRKYFPTNNLKFCMQDSAHAVILNQYTGKLSRFNISTKKMEDSISTGYFKERYDSLLPLFMTDTTSLKYNLKTYKTQPIYKTYQLCQFYEGPFSIGGNIFCALNFSALDSTISETTLRQIPTIVEFTPDLKVKRIVKMQMKLPGKRLAGPLGFTMFAKDTVLVSVDRDGQEYTRDSVAGFFSLSARTTKMIPLNYEEFFPAMGAFNAPRFYNRVLWRDNGKLYANFNSFPFVYDVTNKTKVQLEGMPFDLEASKQGKINDFFYIHRMQKIDGNYLVIASLEKGKIYSLWYTGDFKKLLSKKLLFEGFFKGTYVVGNKVYTMEVYTDKPERKDRAVLHVFEIK